MSVCVIINSLRVYTCHRGPETEPRVSSEMEPVSPGGCQVTRKQRNRLPWCQIRNVPSLRHLLSIRSPTLAKYQILSLLSGREKHFYKLGMASTQTGGACFAEIPSHSPRQGRDVMSDVMLCRRNVGTLFSWLRDISVQWGPSLRGQVTRSVFAIFLVIWCHALNSRAPNGWCHPYQSIRSSVSEVMTNERLLSLSHSFRLTWHLAHFCANYRPLLGWCLGTLDWPSWPRDQEGEETRHFERSGLWRI